MDHGFPDDAAIGAMAAAVLKYTLPKVAWTHAAHFAVTLWFLRHLPFFDGPCDMPLIICRYNDATGTANTDTTGYHHSITLASLRAAAAALDDAPDTPLHTILDGIMAGPLGRSDWLLAHWSRDLLFSVEARREWREPDLAPLPF